MSTKMIFITRKQMAKLKGKHAEKNHHREDVYHFDGTPFNSKTGTNPTDENLDDYDGYVVPLSEIENKHLHRIAKQLAKMPVVEYTPTPSIKRKL